MKNIKYLFLILTIALTSVACESYDDYDADRIPTIGFTRKNMNINGVGGTGSTKSEQVRIFVSEPASEDRTFSITDVEIEDVVEFPPTDRENFSYDETVTIPAGERDGYITVTGINTTLTSDRTYFRLKVVPTPELAVGTTITIGLRK